MQINWQDITNAADDWLALKVRVSGANKPVLQVQTSAQRKMRLQSVSQDHAHTWFWARIEKGHYGVTLLKGERPTVALACVPPINAVALSAAEGQAYFPYWSRYFARALQQSNYSLLHDGDWLLVAYPHLPASGVAPEQWQFDSLDRDNSVGLSVLYDAGVALSADTWVEIDWGCNGSNQLISLYQPDSELVQDGRWKWWCKQAQAGALPPILVWFIGCLDAFVIIDGHTRLQAAIDVGVIPNFIVIYHSVWAEYPPTKKRVENQAAVWQQMERQHALGTMTTERMNAVLLSAFRPYDFYKNQTYAWATLPEADWDETIQRRLQRSVWVMTSSG